MGVGLQVYFNHHFFRLGKTPVLCIGENKKKYTKSRSLIL